ncbi:MAG TPA: elongation factor Ts [Erysipelotrichaceae bacterium]|nr:elongation factor Ts [Erysipelotrichaceae bacterium]
MISASLVKELREKTGAGMMDCKKALEAVDGNVEAAIDWLREKGIAKAAKKSDRIAAEGLTKVVVSGNVAIVVELNSETDFVAKNEQFLTLLDVVANTILDGQPSDVEAALALTTEKGTLETLIAEATATIGEKISLRRFELVSKQDDEVFGSYMHNGGRISAVAVLNGENAEVAKDVAMQVASMQPAYISRNHMPADIVEKERGIQLEIIKNDEAMANKPEKVLAGILEGRLSKSLQDMCLVDQLFFKNPDLKVGQYLKQANTETVAFVRYAVGEGIEKKADNFVEEVMSQAFGK